MPTVTFLIPAEAQAFITSMMRWCRVSPSATMVTMASVFPIIAVLLSGFLLASRRKALDLQEPPADNAPPTIDSDHALF